MDCEHRDFRVRMEVSSFEDTWRFTAAVRIECAECGEPFRFLGVTAGVALRHPTVSKNGLELVAPIEPLGTLQVPPERQTGDIKH